MLRFGIGEFDDGFRLIAKADAKGHGDRGCYADGKNTFCQYVIEQRRFAPFGSLRAESVHFYGLASPAQNDTLCTNHMRTTLFLLAAALLFPASAVAQQYSSSWRPLGPVNIPYFETSMGRVNCVVVSPNNPNRFYLGSPAGGIWSSDDAGATWIPRSDSLPVLGVSSIVIDANNPKLIYIATGDADAKDTYSIGIWKSTDGGTNWLSTGLSWAVGDYHVIYRLLMSPSDSRRILAATSDGLYSTSDSGTNWQRTTPGGNTLWYDVQFQPGNSAVVYATAHGTNFFRSLNGGTNWSQITSGLPTTGVARSIITVSPASPLGVYVLYTSVANNGYYGLYQSKDGGSTFSLRSSSTGSFQFGQQGWFDLALAVSPTNFNEIYAGALLIGKSTDGGATWQTTPYDSTHVDVHALTFLNNVLYACTDGGLHATTNAAISWLDLSASLQIAQIYHVGGAQQNPSLIYVGEQDDGLNRYQNGSWDHVTYGDVGQSIVDPFDQNVVYAMRHPKSLLKTTNAWAGSTFGVGFTETQITQSENSTWPAPPLVMSPSDRQTLFAGLQNVWKTTNGGDSWSAISSFSDGNVCQAISLAPSNANYIYAIRGGAFWRTTDGGSHWTDLSGTLLWNTVALAVSSHDPNKVWVAQNDYNYSITNKIYRSSNGGTNWTAYTGSLPNRNVKSLVYENGSNDALYVGFDAGVYYRNAGMADWQIFNNQLPNAPVADLQINYGSQKLRAGTYGRGLWETYLAVQSPVLTFNVSAGEFVLSWTNPTFVLEQTPTLSAPVWTTIATNSPASVLFAPGQKFFRLRR